MAPVGVSSSLLLVWKALVWELRSTMLLGVVLRRRVRAVKAESWRAAILRVGRVDLCGDPDG